MSRLSGEELRSIERYVATGNRVETRTESRLWQLSGIPTIGPSGILTSYIGALRFYKHGREIAQEGYDKLRVPVTSCTS